MSQIDGMPRWRRTASASRPAALVTKHAGLALTAPPEQRALAGLMASVWAEAPGQGRRGPG